MRFVKIRLRLARDLSMCVKPMECSRVTSTTAINVASRDVVLVEQTSRSIILARVTFLLLIRMSSAISRICPKCDRCEQTS